LKELYKEGDKRYETKIPPGFADSKKAHPEKYGDFIIWKQILEFAKNEEKSVIFVTNDEKEDWWLIKHGEKLQPHPKLKKEFNNFTGQEYHSYTLSQFLEYAEEYLKTPIDSSVIEEVKSTQKNHYINFLNTISYDANYSDAKFLTSIKYNNWIDNIDDNVSKHARLMAYCVVINKNKLKNLNSLDSKLVDEILQDCFKQLNRPDYIANSIGNIFNIPINESIIFHIDNAIKRFGGCDYYYECNDITLLKKFILDNWQPEKN
jgi:hypothetical protein